VTLVDLFWSALIVALLVAWLAAATTTIRPRREGVPPVSPRAMRNLTNRLEAEQRADPGRQS
jgi:hypothetical protein